MRHWSIVALAGALSFAAPASAFEWSSVAMPESVAPPAAALTAPQWSGAGAGFGDYRMGVGRGLSLSVSNAPNFGFSQWVGASRLSSFGLTGSSAKLGYDMGGGVTPWVGVSQSTFGLSRGFSGVDRTIDPLGASPFAQSTSVAAGVDIAITNNISLGFSVSTSTVNRGFGP